MCQLRGRQVVYSMVKVVAHAPDGAGIGINGLGLQALEFEVLEMQYWGQTTNNGLLFKKTLPTRLAAGRC